MSVFNGVEKILTAATGDLRELARLAQCDPKDFYVDQDLSHCDLRGQDLRGMDFSGCNLERAIIDEATKFDPEHDPRNSDESVYLNIKISKHLNTIILSYAEEVGYSYLAWAYKRLLDDGIKLYLKNRTKYYSEIIDNNVYFLDLSKKPSGINSLSVTILSNNFHVEMIEEITSKFKKYDPFQLIFLSALIAKKIKYNSHKDYSNIIPSSLYASGSAYRNGSEKFRL